MDMQLVISSFLTQLAPGIGRVMGELMTRFYIALLKWSVCCL